MDMISFDDIKPGKLLVAKDLGRRVIQITSPLREFKTCFSADVFEKEYFLNNNSKYRSFCQENIYFMKEELLKNNNYLPYLKKPRINEIFGWYILRFENEMYNQEQNL